VHRRQAARQPAGGPYLHTDNDVVAPQATDGLAEIPEAQLARAIGSDPSVVRRLLSAHTINPTLATVAELAAALGLKVTLTPMSAEERKRITEPMLAATG
jgi:DNA-binding phage protein